MLLECLGTAGKDLILLNNGHEDLVNYIALASKSVSALSDK